MTTRIFLTITSLTVLFSCQNSDVPIDIVAPTTDNKTTYDLPKPVDTVIYLNKSLSININNYKDTLTNCQQNTVEGIKSKLDSLTEQIQEKIFDFYKTAYKDYKLGYNVGGGKPEEIENYLPTPTTALNLSKKYYPVAIYIQNSKNCKLGTFGIVFNCDWDEEHGVGVVVKDWKVVEASHAEIAYMGY